MYAEIAREMLASRDWVVPTFNGVPYIEKPPLTYWLTAGSLALLGPSEFAARLWKVLPMLASVALTGALGARLFSRRTGLVGAGILATTLGTFLFSRLAQMDPLLLLCITASAYGIVRAGDVAADRRGAADLWLWGGVAGGVMSKGLPGLVFPLGLLTLWALVRRDGGVWRRVWTLRGVGAAALLVLPWHILAARRVPGFVQFYLIDNQLLRFLGARAYEEDGRSLGTAAFLGVTACALLPWTPYLAAALGRAVRGGARDPRWRFLLGWIAAVIGFFSVSSFKLEYYALPAFPAIALVVAVLVCQASDGAAAGRPEDGSTWLCGTRGAPGVDAHLPVRGDALLPGDGLGVVGGLAHAHGDHPRPVVLVDELPDHPGPRPAAASRDSRTLWRRAAGRGSPVGGGLRRGGLVPRTWARADERRGGRERRPGTVSPRRCGAARGGAASLPEAAGRPPERLCTGRGMC